MGGAAQEATTEKQGADQPEARFVRISEILIHTPSTPDDKALTTARQKAEQLRADVQQGQDFAEIAKANSNGPTANKGGDLGYFGRGDLSPSLEGIVFILHVGDVSEVIRTKQGFAIMKVTDRTSQPAHSDPSRNPRESSLSPELETYKTNVSRKILSAWYSLIPVASQSKSGTVIVLLSIGHDGSVRNPRIDIGSGFEDLDDAALKAVKTSAPYPPLPETTKSDAVTFRLRFQYNPNSGVK